MRREPEWESGYHFVAWLIFTILVFPILYGIGVFMCYTGAGAVLVIFLIVIGIIAALARSGPVKSPGEKPPAPPDPVFPDSILKAGRARRHDTMYAQPDAPPAPTDVNKNKSRPALDVIAWALALGAVADMAVAIFTRNPFSLLCALALFALLAYRMRLPRRDGKDTPPE